MKLDPAHFWKFCANLKIATKDYGEIRFDKPYGTQRYFIDQAFKALNEDVHSLVVLKGRQEGLSTVMLALDLYWMFRFRGILGTIVTQDEPTRDMFREQLDQYYESLPKAWRQKKKNHNRNQFMFMNRSGFAYQISGTRTGNKLGRGKGITFMHATELGSWGNNSDGLASLKSSLSEIHPHRLFVYESTANGYDMFYDMWETAKDAVATRAIFVPWWMKESYSVSEDSAIFKTYFGEPCETDKVIKHLEGTEVEWYKAVQREYGYSFTSNQIAWHRWKLAEEFSDDADMMHQEYPPTEDYAFKLTGSQFYPSSALNDLLNLARGRNAATYHIQFGARFEDTTIVPCDARFANLKIYSAAQTGGMKAGLYYTMGADPAYGSSEWKDGSALHIDRCYGDFIEQVAEFHSVACTTHQFAWVIAILAGWYENCIVNLELNGPGQVVYQELDQLQRIVQSSNASDQKALANIVGNVKHYVYQKYNGGNRSGNIKHTITTQQSKETMMTKHRDSVVKGITDIASIECVYEMKKVVRDGGTIEAGGRDKDDRCIAAALSHTTWLDNLRVRLLQMGITKNRAAAVERGPLPADSRVAPATYAFHKFMAEREAAVKERARQARTIGRQMRR